MANESTATTLQHQIATVFAAPAVYLVTVAALAGIIWMAIDWFYRGRISNLTERLARRDDEISLLKERVDKAESGQIASAAEQPASTSSQGVIAIDRGTDAIARQRAIAVLGNAAIEAKDVARLGRSAARAEAEKALPRMRAALLTAKKAFGTEIVPPIDPPEIELELSRRLVEKVRPYLKEGHDEEARETAIKYLESIEILK
jgi:hypothetical protein